MHDIVNSHLSGIGIVVVVLNIIGALGAVYWNFKASHIGILFKSRFIVGLLAFIYVIAYSCLLFTEISSAAWSESLRLFAVLAWYFVWIDPPRKAMKAQHDLSAKLEREVLKRMGINDEDGNEK